jgi:hypothetical protein
VPFNSDDIVVHRELLRETIPGILFRVCYNPGKEGERMPTDKQPTSYRLSDEAKAMLADIAGWYGTSATGALEIAVRGMYGAGPPQAVPVSQSVVEEVRERTRPKKPGRPRRKT